jgi:hypothetical protein
MAGRFRRKEATSDPVQYEITFVIQEDRCRDAPAVPAPTLSLIAARTNVRLDPISSTASGPPRAIKI